MATRNYVPRANGEGSIGTEKKHWGSAFFDKLAVKTLEVIGGGAENDAQPATVGWVKISLKNIFSDLLSKTGFSVSFGATGYISFGSLFGGLKIQWGNVTKAMVPTPENEPIRYVTLPISFSENTYSVVTWDDNTGNDVLRIYKSSYEDRARFKIKVVIYENGSTKVTTGSFGMSFLAIGR